MKRLRNLSTPSRRYQRETDVPAEDSPNWRAVTCDGAENTESIRAAISRVQHLRRKPVLLKYIVTYWWTAAQEELRMRNLPGSRTASDDGRTS